MKRRVIALCGLLPGLLLGGRALGIAPSAAENPYAGIVDRNVFGLRPPPPPPEMVQTSAPPSKITLLGIASMFGKKTAILQAVEPGKPAPPGQAAPMVLSEGEAQQGIEVNAIDEKAGAVKVNNRGAELTLTFEKDGVKLPAGPAPAALPGMPGIPGAPVGMAAMPAFSPNAGIPVPNMNPAAASPSGIANATASGAATASATSPLPTRPVRTADQPLNYAQAMALVELNREANKTLVANGLMPPLPPTPFTPAAEAPAQNPVNTTPNTPALPGLPGLPLPPPGFKLPGQ